MHSLLIYSYLGVLLIAGSPFFVQAQLLDPVSIEIDSTTLPDTHIVDEQLIVTLRASIEESWYLYSISLPDKSGPIETSFSTRSDFYSIDGDIIESEADVKYDPNFGYDLGLHSGEAIFRIPMQFSQNSPGNVELEIFMHYQACDDRSCLPPVTKSVSTEIELIGVNESLSADNFRSRDRGKGVLADEKLSDSDGGEASDGPVLYSYLLYLLPVLFIGVFLFLFIRYRRT